MHDLGVIQRMNQEAIDNSTPLCETGNMTNKEEVTRMNATDLEVGDQVTVRVSGPGWDKIVERENMPFTDQGLWAGEVVSTDGPREIMVKLHGSTDSAGHQWCGWIPTEPREPENWDLELVPDLEAGDFAKIVPGGFSRQPDGSVVEIHGRVGNYWDMLYLAGQGGSSYLFERRELEKIGLPKEQPPADWEQELLGVAPEPDVGGAATEDIVLYIIRESVMNGMLGQGTFSPEEIEGAVERAAEKVQDFLYRERSVARSEGWSEGWDDAVNNMRDYLGSKLE